MGAGVRGLILLLIRCYVSRLLFSMWSKAKLESGAATLRFRLAEAVDFQRPNESWSCELK